MTPFGEAHERSAWKAALAPTPGCIEIHKFAQPLCDADAKHLAVCSRCQTELALWQEFNESVPRAEEGAAVTWIAREMRRRFPAQPEHKPGWWRRLVAMPGYRLSGALAALLVLAGSVALFTLRSRTVLAPTMMDEGALRSQAVAVVSPLGDLESPPVEFHWRPVAAAAIYQVEILEVDRHSLWKSETQQTRLAIPAGIRAVMAPGKTLLWEVTARSQSGATLATSGPQKFKVKVKKTSGEEL